jgi:hypothetical protein
LYGITANPVLPCQVEGNRDVLPEQLEEFLPSVGEVLVQAQRLQPGQDVPGIPSGGSPAGLTRLQKYDTHSCFRQMESQGATRKPRPNNDNISIQILFQ